MAKIKLENDVICLYIKEAKTSYFDVDKFFKIDLYNKKYYTIKGDKLQSLDWIFSEEEYEDLVINSISETKKMIVNHINVIYSHKQRNELERIPKVEKQLIISREILESLEKFNNDRGIN